MKTFSGDFSVTNTFVGFLQCLLDLSLNKHRGQNAELGGKQVGQENMFRTCNVLMIGALALDYKEIDGLISFK